MVGADGAPSSVSGEARARPWRTSRPDPGVCADHPFLAVVTDNLVEHRRPRHREVPGPSHGASDQLQPEVLPQPSQT